jgi:peptidoglycan/xylan/chitin deacetylase (PgdA/CDA1 family)
MDVVIAIDDLHPEQGWGCEGDESVGYIEELNKEYGCKFNLFIPSNYHNKYPITKEWVDFWKSKDYVELSNHGHYHKCKNKGVGEMEFFELNHSESVQRIQKSLELWKKCGYKPKGFRAPGWGLTQESADAVSSYFDWIAGHTNINKGLSFGTQFFEGCDGIHETDNIDLWDNRFMFQSHIAGDWNDNCWNEKNYNNFRNILEYLSTQYKLSYKTMSEL